MGGAHSLTEDWMSESKKTSDDGSMNSRKPKDWCIDRDDKEDIILKEKLDHLRKNFSHLERLVVNFVDSRRSFGSIYSRKTRGYPKHSPTEPAQRRIRLWEDTGKV